jgi:hypothetical protein
MKKYLLPIIAAIALSGCATIVSGSQQSIFIETPHANGAECRLTDSKNGSWRLDSSPGSVFVTKGNGPMNIVCTKKGFETTVIKVEEEVAGATMGNIILGGGIGILVDAASGAAQKYPDSIILWMKPSSFANAAARKAWEDEKALYEKKIKEAEEAKRAAQRSNNNN